MNEQADNSGLEDAIRRLAARWNEYARTPASGPRGEARRSEAEKCAIELLCLVANTATRGDA